MKKVLFMGIASAILFLCLSVPCFAAAPPVDTNSYNIINGDLLQWQNMAVAGSIRSQNNGNNIVNYICSTESNPLGNGYVSMFTVASYNVPTGFMVAGKSYSFGFYIPTNAEISSPSFSYKNQFGGSVIRIGLGTWDGENFTPWNNAYMDIDSSNIESLQGKSHILTFVCPDYSGLEIRAMITFIETRTGNYVYNRYYYFGRGVFLIDEQQKENIDNYNQWFYGGNPEDYSNPFTTENYDLGAASDKEQLGAAFDSFEEGLDNISAPFRITGRLLNDIFGHDSPLAIVGVIVFLVLILAVVFRLFGVT